MSKVSTCTISFSRYQVPVYKNVFLKIVSQKLVIFCYDIVFYMLHRGNPVLPKNLCHVFLKLDSALRFTRGVGFTELQSYFSLPFHDFSVISDVAVARWERPFHPDSQIRDDADNPEQLRTFKLLWHVLVCVSDQGQAPEATVWHNPCAGYQPCGPVLYAGTAKLPTAFLTLN